VGRASRLKRERKVRPPNRRLLMTLMNEPFQPATFLRGGDVERLLRKLDGWACRPAVTDV
jgi:hypothetical protein